jgi:crotonobetainyl-CoA:carnitine CoA-transferase CaiB-like acyl-CoA transferase
MSSDDTLQTISLLETVKVIDFSVLSPAGLAQQLADLGADVIKVERPGKGDPVRQIAWPVIEGVNLEHWHWNRGKRSLALDLRSAEGIEVFVDLVRTADVLVEGMRPGALERLGLTLERLWQIKPALVVCGMSGYGASGPYRDVPAHGLAFDAMAGVAPPGRTKDGFATIAPHTSIGMNAAALYGALGVVSAVLRARATGAGCALEIAQSDAAIAVNWLRIEGEAAYDRPTEEVTDRHGAAFDERRAVGFDDFDDAVRYQYYASSDGYVLLMASDRKFWRNFCEGVHRMDLYEAQPGEEMADHARGNSELRRELSKIFATRTTSEWMEYAARVDTAIAPVHDSRSVRNDPQARDRIDWLPSRTHAADLMRTPLKLVGAQLPEPRRAPTVGQQTDEVLREVLGYTPERIADLREHEIVE